MNSQTGANPQILLPLSQAIMKQLIEEVKVFVNKGIFHRDLKLKNILINTNSEEPQIWVICLLSNRNTPACAHRGNLLR